MEKTSRSSFPRWLFAVLAIGGLLASGINIGIMSIEGYTILSILLAVGYGVFGLLMFLGALNTR